MGSNVTDRGHKQKLPAGRFCRRCGAEIATANLMDLDPGLDRQHFSLVLNGGRRHRLARRNGRSSPRCTSGMGE
jgi:hypothetical protein